MQKNFFFKKKTQQKTLWDNFLSLSLDFLEYHREKWKFVGINNRIIINKIKKILITLFPQVSFINDYN